MSAANLSGRRRFPPPRRVIALRAVVVLALLALALWQFRVDNRAPPAPHAPGALALVHRAVDGDTLLLADHTRVRLLGVDTPETKRPEAPVEPWGPEAHEFTRAHVEGREVRLEFDKERYDKYGRVLAYVYLDDWFLNEELIRAGMGRAITNHPYSEAMKRRFRAAEREAQQKRLGIWSDWTPGPRDRNGQRRG
jgi:micrococcal nuclease